MSQANKVEEPQARESEGVLGRLFGRGGHEAAGKATLELRDIQGLSTEEASAMLRVKDQTLKSRLHRGRLILRKQLADFAGGLSMHRPIYGT